MHSVHRLVRGLAVMVVVGTPRIAAAQASVPTPASRQMTITGTVIDMACKFSKGSSGPSHLACFEGCAKAGVAIGILTGDGNLYIPVQHEVGQNPRLQPFAEQVVTVTGQVFAAGGAHTIEIATIQKKS